MKDILKMVYGDQKEVKLESQKIELGVIDDAISMYKKGLGDFDEASKKRVEAASKYLDSKDIFEKAIKELKKTEKLVKDLGIDIPANVKTALDEANRYSKLAGDYAKELR